MLALVLVFVIDTGGVGVSGGVDVVDSVGVAVDDDVGVGVDVDIDIGVDVTLALMSVLVLMV